MRPSFYLHLHPPTIPAAQARWRYTLGAGGIAVFLLFILLLSGVLLTFYYVPYPQEAAHSIQRITFLVPYGSFIRNLHFWAAQGLVIISLIHLSRVLLTGAYLPPRRFNYFLGFVIFLFILWENFSGYILRWDEGIHWALVIGTNLIKVIPIIGMPLFTVIMGGNQINPDTLTRFYAFHSIGIFLPLVWFTGWHLFRVRRDGGIAYAKEPSSKYSFNRNQSGYLRIHRSILVQREGIAALICLGLLIIWSNLFPAPLALPMGEIQRDNVEAHAPWFFLWVQALLSFGDPLIWGVLLPLMVFLVPLLIPYVLPLPNLSELGRWFPPSGRAAQIVYLCWLSLLVGLTLFGFFRWGFNL